ncbi:hypothetical protein K2P56_03375 [Patescibacteria group bacterium]|nr:hypothetical protein [Patescibacteria group bacterium]
MVFGRERVRAGRAFGTRAFLTVVSLFATATLTTPARAQEASEPSNVVALEGVDFTDRTISSFAPLGATFADVPRLNLGETPRTRDESEGPGEDEIIVTAQREEGFAVAPHPDDLVDPFERLGMRTNHNLENEGLDERFIRPEDREGWRGVDVSLLNTGRFSIEAQVKRGAGFEFTYHFGRD